LSILASASIVAEAVLAIACLTPSILPLVIAHATALHLH